MFSPELSVVTGVFNGEVELEASLRSVLDQRHIDLELIVVDDGSTDRTYSLLMDMSAGDPRLRVVGQEQNCGLTEALIRGCSIASAPYIARHDSGDLSLPGRFSKQLEAMKQRPWCSLLSCWTVLVGPRSEVLQEICPTLSPEAATAGLLAQELSTLAGVTHHGSVMFRKSDYERVGGYRKEFYFAQDLDLWTRLADIGKLSYVEEILYHAHIRPGCLSARYREQQMALSEVILQVSARRRRGQEFQELLRQAQEIRPYGQPAFDHAACANGHYWIGRMLHARHDRRCVNYFRQAVNSQPTFLRARMRLMLAQLRPRSFWQ